MTIEQAALQQVLAAGIPPHLSGFRYLQTAIIICYKDVDKLSMVTKILYPEVSKAHKLSDWRCVERSIRAAIRRGVGLKVSNSVFISAAVWNIKQLKNPPE